MTPTQEEKAAQEKWNRAQRLVVAGAVAPVLRSQARTASRRKVGLTDKDGNVVRYVSVADVQEALLRREEIELDVAEPSRVSICSACGRRFLLPDLPNVRRRKKCSRCAYSRCADCGKQSTSKPKGVYRCIPCRKKRTDARMACVGCGKKVQKVGAKECRPCLDKRTRPPDVLCQDCGKVLKSTSTRERARAGKASGYCKPCFVKNKMRKKKE